MLIYILVGLTEYMNILKTKLFHKTQKRCLIYKDDFKVFPYYFSLFCKKFEKEEWKRDCSDYWSEIHGQGFLKHLFNENIGNSNDINSEKKSKKNLGLWA